VTRTQQQREANDFDLTLFNLIESAEYYAERAHGNSSPWRFVASTLRMARSPVRRMMHDDDQRATL
jgi:hypothetical protein